MTFLATLLPLYSEVFQGDLLRYILGAGGTYLVICVLLSRRLAAQKIRATDPPKGQIRRELLASLRTVLIFAASGTSIALGANAGWMTVYQDIGAYGIGYFLFSTAALIVLHDAWFYWTHRALHRPRMFRWFHRTHHRSHQPTPFTAYSFDVGEAVVNAVYLPLILLVLPAHPVALFIFVTHMMLRNAIGHSGTEVFPARADGRPLVGWLTSVTHHDLHHANARYNHGLYFSWWDRWMGTEHPGYLDAFAKVAPRVSARMAKAALLISLLALGGLATRAEAEPISGDYASPGLGLIVRFAPCSDLPGQCGQLLWVWDEQDAPHASPGDVVLSDLRVQGGVWKGQLRDPGSGRTYRGTIRRLGQDRLELKGCAGPLCKRQTWYSTRYLRRILAQADG